MKLKARFLRWWHCLTHLHRTLTIRNRRGEVVVIGCGDCSYCPYLAIDGPESLAAAIAHLRKVRE